MDIKKAKDLIRKHEGLRLKPYICPAGKVTIGYGRNIQDKGISKVEAELMLNNDVNECVLDLERIFGTDEFDTYSESLQTALIDMRFQLGYYGFRGFKKMILAVKGYDLEKARAEAKDSEWYKQVPDRAKRVIGMFVE
jgi:lysozyme